MDANQNKQYGQTALMVLLFVWWVTAWYIERIDFLARPVDLPYLADIVNPIIQSVPPGLQFILEFFSFRVLRHVVPFAAGWWLARRGALALIQELYDLPDQASAQTFLARSQSTDAPQGGTIAIRRTEFAKDRLQIPLLRYGGPGRISVKQGDVVWTERNGRFQHVYGPGIHRLNRYENVRGALDVRPQERIDAKVTLITEDGIELHTTLAVTFHIGRGDLLPTVADPYPFEPDNVYLAGYAETLLIDDHIDNWETLPLKLTEAVLRDIVSKKTLDRLLYPANPELRPHEIVKERMDRQSKTELAKWGIDLVSTRLGALQAPNEVTQQRIEYWQIHWRQHHRAKDVSDEAASLVEIEVGRAQAKAAAIKRILEGVRDGQQLLTSGNTDDVVALRLVDAMARVTQQSTPNRGTQLLGARIEALRGQIQSDE